MPHLIGSADIITILNMYGHCQSYSCTLEIEAVMGNSAIAYKSILPPSISTEHNSVVNLCWDNCNLNEETPSGAGTTHTAHGIIIQELKSEANLLANDFSNLPKSKERTVHSIMEDCSSQAIESSVFAILLQKSSCFTVDKSHVSPS